MPARWRTAHDQPFPTVGRGEARRGVIAGFMVAIGHAGHGTIGPPSDSDGRSRTILKAMAGSAYRLAQVKLAAWLGSPWPS
jgi:hypothetical protein